MNQIGEAPIYFESCTGFTASDLCEKKARYLKQGQNISVIGECAGSLIMLTGKYLIGIVHLQLSP